MRSPRIDILAVEDDLATRSALFGLLGDDRFDVTFSRTAEAGLEHLRCRTFDLVLADSGLPNHAGAWMLAQAKQSGLLHGPALMLTSDAKVAPNDWLAVIRKPVDGRQLLQAIRALLETRVGN